MNPSPAAYSPDKPFGSGASPIAIHSKVETTEEVNQAPFANIPSSIGTGPKATIGEHHEITESVGPGPDYMPPPFGADGKGSRMGVRPPDETPEDIPGPGTYNPKDDFGRQSRGGQLLGPADRSPYELNSNPGPGTYDPSSTPLPTRITIGSSSPAERPEDLPGPGTYNPNDDFGVHSRSAQLLGPTDRSPYELNSNPGPGTYDPRTSSVPTKITIGSSSPAERPEDLPGPGTYNPNDDFGRQSRGGQLLGPTDRSPYELNSNPGPGTYDPSSSPLPTKIAIGSASPAERPEDLPGPGTYNPNDDFGAHARSAQILGSTERSPYELNSNPGPGTYDPSSSPLPTRITIGSSSPAERPEDLPGPGTYNPNDEFGAHARSAQLLGPTERSPYELNSNPGPATYDPDVPTLPTAIIIGNVTSPVASDEVPGPGAYNDPRTFRPSANHGQIHERPASPRPASTPGPGIYSPARFGSDAPKIAVSPRRPSSRASERPAPGQYSPNRPFGSDARTTSLAQGPTRRGATSALSNPGPGTYNPRSRKSGPAYTISGSRPAERKEPTGEYRNLKSTLGGPRYSLRGRCPLEIVYD
jgi:hypothetical protein